MKHTQHANGQNISTQETVIRASPSDCTCKNEPQHPEFKIQPLHIAAYGDWWNDLPLHMAACTGCINCIKKIPEDDRLAIIKHDRVRNSTALHIAAAYGHTNVVEVLLDKDANIEAIDQYGYTPLHMAAIYGKYDTAKLLLERQANKNSSDNWWYTPLHSAVQHGHFHIVELLLHHNASMRYKSKGEGDTVLHWVVKCNKEDIAQLLLNKLIEIHQIEPINIRNNDRNTMLHLAVEYGMENLGRRLLDSGAKIDMQNQDGNTALHLAAIHGRENLAQLLLNKLIQINQIKQQINIQNNDKNTVLHLAVKDGGENLVKLLLDNGAKIGIENKDGNTALYLAVKCKQENIAQLLLNKLIQINQIEQINIQNNNNNTVLHLAIKYGMKNLVGLLLDSGAKDIQDKRGNIALHLAVKYNQKNIVQLLLNKFNKNNNRNTVLIQQINQIDIQNKDQNTALHLAAIYGIENLVELLLDNGAKIDMQNQEGMMALECAVKHRHANVVKLLLDRGNKINKQNKWGAAALHWASQQSDLDGIELLLNAGVKVDDQNEDGNTALHVAYKQCCRFVGNYHEFTRSRQLDTVKFLERYHAKKDIKNKQGYSPEDYAYLVFIRNCYGINLLNSSDVSHRVEKGILGYLLQNNKFKQRNTPANQNITRVYLPAETLMDIFSFITTDLYLDATGQVTQSGTQLPFVNRWITSNHGREDIIQELRDYVGNNININPNQAMEYERVASGLLDNARALRDLRRGMGSNYGEYDMDVW
ncbi:ankyrin repeat domain-containing protein [Candidatus Cardinium hertigii]|nr:ankyrin repeat domain-containing protein [Candidatus Cardinium hertigii]